MPTTRPPLVLLHGGAASWQLCAALLPGLAVRWHPDAVDLRGHGRSGRIPGHERLHAYADDISRCIAHAIGAPTTMIFARRTIPIR